MPYIRIILNRCQREIKAERRSQGMAQARITGGRWPVGSEHGAALPSCAAEAGLACGTRGAGSSCLVRHCAAAMVSRLLSCDWTHRFLHQPGDWACPVLSGISAGADAFGNRVAPLWERFIASEAPTRSVDVLEHSQRSHAVGPFVLAEREPSRCERRIILRLRSGQPQTDWLFHAARRAHTRAFLLHPQIRIHLLH